MRNRFLVFAFVLLALQGVAQKKIDWKTLAQVSFEEEYSDALASYIMIPTFEAPVKALEGQEVEIAGYMIPLDVAMNQYVISANPFAACFFCGNAGPESVMDVMFTEKQKLKTDEYVTLRGTLKLNVHDIYHLNYILEDAEIVAD